MISAQELNQLAAVMRANGVNYLKTQDITLKLQVPEVQVRPLNIPSVHIPGIPSVSSESVPHEVNEVASLLKLGDTDLVEKLFPDYSMQDRING